MLTPTYPSKDFHLGDLLTVTTGRMLSPTNMAGLEALVDFVVGDHVGPHGLLTAVPGIVKPALLEQHPRLHTVIAAADLAGDREVPPREVGPMLNALCARYGTLWLVTSRKAQS